MRRIHLRRTRRERAFTLIELVVAMVLVAIIVGATVFFALPLFQTVDVTTRAELTDIADNSLQRIGRDVRLALPNSVRVNNTAVPGSVFLEFLAVRTAGRYRADGGGASTGTDCPADGVSVPAADQLSFDVADTCFKSLGPVANAVDITANSDFLVLSNYGAKALPIPDFPGQTAYEAGAANRVLITGRINEGPRVRISFAATTFQRTLHDSPGKRFFVISGPVTYECNTTTGRLNRYSGYPIAAAQPTAFGVPAALIAENVANSPSACNFNYAANVGPQIGLLTLSLTLSKTLSSGNAEAVSLYHAIHVSNVP